MSVYSGFATRQQESIYDKLVEKALTLMSSKIRAGYSSGKYQAQEVLICLIPLNVYLNERLILITARRAYR